MTMHVFHPTDARDLLARDSLLGSTMRETPTPWPLAEEYPLVLDPCDTSASYCVRVESEIVAHANFWERRIVLPDKTLAGTCALIGNVATHPAWRGRGTTRPLFARFDALAEDHKLDLMLLWAEDDLHPFYQKSGFRSWGREARYTFRRVDLEGLFEETTGQQLPGSPSRLDDHSRYQRLMDLRPAIPTLERPSAAFSRLLQIPHTRLLLDDDRGYAIIGRGSDMVGVLHEWGTTTPASLLRLACRAMRAENLDLLTLLAPGSLDPAWKRELAKFAARSEVRPMCMAKGTGILKPALQDLFVWGLDSI